MIIYISGPITKDKNYYEKFLNAEKRLKEAGYEVINPAKIATLLPNSFEYGDYMDIDLNLLKKCDAIYLLKNWKNSLGAVIEQKLAKELGLKVIYQVSKNERIEVLEK